MAVQPRRCQGGLPKRTSIAQAGRWRKDEERAKRLAAALRENLRRRKAQAREQARRAAPSHRTPQRTDLERRAGRFEPGAVLAVELRADHLAAPAA